MNNREIKFRAWNSKLNQIQHWDEIKTMNANILFQNNPEIPMMQYTGLKDKNGKEIYEGDIVKTDNKYYPIMFVRYTAGIINYHDGDWDEFYCGFDLGIPNDECNVMHYQITDEVEVIGNIYENPELLKGR